MSTVRSVLRTVTRRVILPALGPRYARHEGAILPPKHLRFCGLEFRDHAYYLESARAEVTRLKTHCGLTDDSRVLDIGCGSGRLAIALREQLPELRSYLGVDVHRPSIDWCGRWLSDTEGRFRFEWIDQQNSRYNPDGRIDAQHARLPCDDGTVDVVNLFSVFSHLEQPDIEASVAELSRVLSRDGRVFLTAFTTDDQAEHVVVNPDTPGRHWSGPLHCVRLRRTWFKSLLTSHGLASACGPDGAEVDGQTAWYLRPM